MLTEEKFIAPLSQFIAEEKKQPGFKARVRIMRGDISAPGLGLSPAESREIAERATEALHLAAAYNLVLPYELGWKVNVEGTQNVLDFIGGMRKLARFGYLSTTAISGTHRGLFSEDDFNVGQRFKNHYEATKFEAEARVRQKMQEIPTIIFRPTIIVGSSKTGEFEKIDGPYYAFRMISRKMHFIFQKAPEVKFHLEPVDFVAEAVYALFQKPEALGKTIHLADPEPLSYDAFFDLVFEKWPTFKPFIRLPGKFMLPLFSLPGFAKISGIPKQSFLYTLTPVDYGTKRMQALLQGTGIHCPPIASYVGVLLDYFNSKPFL